MGKKSKNKSKISGSEKTTLKTEKKLNAKQKKELAMIGEDDIEKILADIEREEAKRQNVIETVVPPPSHRVNFSWTAHPFKDELIMFGGEFFDGQKTIVYGDMFFYNIAKNEWSVVKAPGAPPPRCGHQAVVVPANKGELWIFGGEYSSPSQLQFYHYKDLWVYRFGEKSWTKITATGGPTGRSGHRMVYITKQLVIFGGFHDNIRDYRYYNDVHIFNLTTYQWNKLEISGIPPAPRSGCIVLPTPDNKVLVYGGYSKERIKKNVDRGQVHTDMFLLTPEKNDASGLKWKWILQRQGGITISPRCSATGIVVQPNLAYIFGGVFDKEESDEDINGIFYNDLYGLDLEKYQWRTVTVNGTKDMHGKRRRRKQKDNDKEEDKEDQISDTEHESALIKEISEPTSISDDGIFTVTVGTSAVSSTMTLDETQSHNVFSPSPRINCGLSVKHGVLYLYGGMIEKGSTQYTLNDLYKLDFRKLDEWNTIIECDLSSQKWVESESSDAGSDDEDDSEDNSEEFDDQSSSNEKMDVDDN